MLIAFVPCAPHNPLVPGKGWGRLGLHELIEPDAGYAALVKAYVTDQIDAKVPVCLMLPWGKWPQIPWDVFSGNMRWTGMRMDAKKLADASSDWMWLTSRLDELVAKDPTRFLLYVGSYPPMPLTAAGLSRYLDAGVGMVFDALSTQQGTLATAGVWGAHVQGKRVWTEANGKSPSLTTADVVTSVPAWARMDKWAKPAAQAWPLDKHPPKSVAWFSNGIKTADDWLAAQVAVDAGLDLCVNLHETNYLSRLQRMAGV